MVPEAAASGTSKTNDAVLSGIANSGFIGPGAGEIGGNWLMNGSGEHAVGTFVGSQQGPKK